MTCENRGEALNAGPCKQEPVAKQTQKWVWSMRITCGFLYLSIDPDGNDQQGENLLEGETHQAGQGWCDCCKTQTVLQLFWRNLDTCSTSLLVKINEHFHFVKNRLSVKKRNMLKLIRS